MSKEEYRDISPALDVLYSISKRVQETQHPYKEYIHMSVVEYLMQFCTIRVATCRRGGHDYGLAKFLHEKRLKTFMISPNLIQSRMMELEYNNFNEKSNSLYNGIKFVSWTKNSPFSLYGGGKRLDSDTQIIAINNSFLFSKNFESKLYGVIRNFIFSKDVIDKSFYIIFVH